MDLFVCEGYDGDTNSIPMLWRTHLAAGISSVWLLTLVPEGLTTSTVGATLLAAALGSLLPDLDASDSAIKHVKVGKVAIFEPFADVMYHYLGHRGPAHSIVGVSFLMLIAIPLWLWLGWQCYLGLILGYLSHLAADASTKTGIQFLYPHKRHWYTLPTRLRVVTGSDFETIPFVVLALTALLLLLTLLPLAYS